MDEASLSRAADHFADAARFVREAQRAVERTDDVEATQFMDSARKAARDGIYELRSGS